LEGLKVIEDLVCTSRVLRLFWWSRGGHARQEEERRRRSEGQHERRITYY
jgi:hypothetical protein